MPTPMPARTAAAVSRAVALVAAAAAAVIAFPVAADASTQAPVLTLNGQGVQHAPGAVHPDTFSNCTVSTSGDIALTPGSTLGQVTNLCSGGYELSLQSDGNLVVYGPSGAALWYAGTANSATTTLAAQTDGNLVVYSGGRALWNAGTGGHPGAYTCFQTDGNLVVYADNGSGIRSCQGAALWDSGS